MRINLNLKSYVPLMQRVLLVSLFAYIVYTVFAFDKLDAVGAVVQKSAWLHGAMPVWCVGSLALLVAFRSRFALVLNGSDTLVLIFGAIVLLTYNYELNPGVERLWLYAQLLVAWFSLRILLTNMRELKTWLLVLLVLVGVVEAVTGVLQLYGFAVSNHALYKTTGHFFNPGPYSGFLATLFPVGLWLVLHFKNNGKWFRPQVFLHYTGWVYLLCALSVLPAGMSRIAWAAALVSSLWVVWFETQLVVRLKDYISKYPKRSLVCTILLGFVMIAGSAFVYMLKKDSADGRLLMWKVSASAIADHPVSGSGVGGFAAAFAKAQAEYFDTGLASTQEQLVAGTPEYAFNEFLQFGIELGVFGLLVFLLLIGYSLYRGVQSKQTAATGALVALMVFALASYPFHLPEFWLLLVVLLAIVNSGDNKEIAGFRCSCNRWIMVVILVIMGVWSGYAEKENRSFYNAHVKWKMLQPSFAMKSYREVKGDYEQLLPLLSHNSNFLFETAQCCRYSDDHVRAIELLDRAAALSSDPMILYMKAVNLQAIGNYDKAEQTLRSGIAMLPERIYPYYLLAKLYADSAYNKVDKLKEVAEVVLTKDPKVESTAIKEMREEVTSLLNAIK